MKSLKNNTTGKLKSAIKTAKSIAESYRCEVSNRGKVVGAYDSRKYCKLWPIIIVGNPVEMYVEFLPENGNISVFVRYANKQIASCQTVEPKDLLKTTTQLILDFRARGVSHPAPTCKEVDSENQPTTASTDFYTTQQQKLCIQTLDQEEAEDTNYSLAGDGNSAQVDDAIGALDGISVFGLGCVLQHLADNTPELSEYLHPLLHPVVPITFTTPIPITGKESVCLNDVGNNKIEISASRKLVPTKTTTINKSFSLNNVAFDIVNGKVENITVDGAMNLRANGVNLKTNESGNILWLSVKNK